MAKYEIDQIKRAEEGHDWTHKMNLRISGLKGTTNYLSINKEQLEKIKEILK